MRHSQTREIYITSGGDIFTRWGTALLPKSAHTCVRIFAQDGRGSPRKQTNARHSPRHPVLVPISCRSAALLLDSDET
eukprot:2695762-Pleurochrysis_carterae.AAC.1